MRIIEENKSRLSELCRIHGVQELYIFGSVTRDDIRPDSDIDLAVVFSRSKVAGSFDRYFDLKSDLEDLFGRSVDLICLSAVRNSVFRQELDATKTLVYAA